MEQPIFGKILTLDLFKQITLIWVADYHYPLYRFESLQPSRWLRPDAEGDLRADRAALYQQCTDCESGDGRQGAYNINKEDAWLPIHASSPDWRVNSVSRPERSVDYTESMLSICSRDQPRRSSGRLSSTQGWWVRIRRRGLPACCQGLPSGGDSPCCKPGIIKIPGRLWQ